MGTLLRFRKALSPRTPLAAQLFALEGAGKNLGLTKIHIDMMPIGSTDHQPIQWILQIARNKGRLDAMRV